MKHLDTGSDKIKKICDAIRHETLEPAKQQAKMLIEQASDQASRMIQEAKDQVELMFEQAKKQQAHEKLVFEASMAQAAKLFKEQLRIEIESQFLSSTLDQLSVDLFNQSELVAQIVSALVNGFHQKSLNGDLTLILGAGLDREVVVKGLAAQIKARMKTIHSLPSLNGIVIKSADDHVSLELNPQQLTESLMHTLRADFRKYFYQG